MKAIDSKAVPFRTHKRNPFVGALFSLLLSAIMIWTAAAHAQSGMKRTPMPGVTVEIVELKRIGDKTVGLVYAIKNETNKKLGLDQLGVRTIMGRGFVAGLVALVDFKNGKRYGVGSAGSNCLCTGNVAVPAGGTMQLWAQFAAPPASVDKVAVMIGNVPPFYNVPITR